MARNEISVDGGEDNIRVEQLVLKRYPSLSRKSCREFILNSSVLINGKRARKGRRLHIGDVVCLDGDEIKKYFTDFSPVPSASISTKIIYRDGDVLAVEKEPGIDCAPIRASDTRTLISAALKIEPGLKNIKGWKSRESGLLYRLDRDVSGIVLFALTQKSFQVLLSDSQKDRVSKTYLAVVENFRGEIFQRAGTISAGKPEMKNRGKKVVFKKLAFHPGKTLRETMEKFSRRAGARVSARAYLTRIEPVIHVERFSLVKIEIRRAFRHQIRSVLGALGHPVAGDGAYGSRSGRQREDIMLHCWKLWFPHPRSRKILNLESRPDRILQYNKAFAERKDILR